MNEKLYILLVDDDEDDRRLFTEALEESGQPYSLECAARYQDLFVILRNDEKPDLIFLDINIPGVSGHECLKRLKEDTDTQNIPILIYSGSKSPDDMELAYEAGAHLYIIKPYAPANLAEALKKVFEKDWKQNPERPTKFEFLVNTAFV